MASGSSRGSAQKLLFLVFATFLIAGCARIGAMSRVDPLSVAVYPGGAAHGENTPSGDCPLASSAGSFSRGAVDLDCFLFPEDRPPARPLPGRQQAGAAPPQRAYARAATDATYRNRLTALLLKHSDDICVEEMGRLTGNEATVNASLNILGTAATTTANIVTGELAQGILAGVGTFAGASRSHIRADIYRNTFSYAISRAITRERQRLREIIEGRYGQTPPQFTVDDAIRAANEYHGVCSFYKGLELVLASVEGDQRSRDAERRLAQIGELEQQLTRLQTQLALPTAQGTLKTTLEENISEVNERIQALVLAGAPQPTAPPAQRPNEGQGQNEGATQNQNQNQNENQGEGQQGTNEAEPDRPDSS